MDLAYGRVASIECPGWRAIPIVQVGKWEFGDGEHQQIVGDGLLPVEGGGVPDSKLFHCLASRCLQRGLRRAHWTRGTVGADSLGYTGTESCLWMLVSGNFGRILPRLSSGSRDFGWSGRKF